MATEEPCYQASSRPGSRAKVAKRGSGRPEVCEARSGLLWLLAPAEAWSGRDPGHPQNGALVSKEASQVVAAMRF